jgi:hypothetical protein
MRGNADELSHRCQVEPIGSMTRAISGTSKTRAMGVNASREISRSPICHGGVLRPLLLVLRLCAWGDRCVIYLVHYLPAHTGG